MASGETEKIVFAFWIVFGRMWICARVVFTHFSRICVRNSILRSV